MCNCIVSFSVCENTIHGGKKNYTPTPGLFLFSCSFFALYPYLFLCRDFPGVCLLSLLYNTLNTNIHVPGGIRTRNPSRRAATHIRFRPRGRRDRIEPILTYSATRTSKQGNDTHCSKYQIFSAETASHKPSKCNKGSSTFNSN